MRMTLLAASAVLVLAPLGAGAQDGVADVDDFEVDTAQNLLDLCSVDEGSQYYPGALYFCAGFFEGIKNYHDSMSSGPEIEPIVCPPRGVAVRDAIAAYVAYGRANPQYLGEAPADNVMRAAIAQWPCS